MRVMSITTMMLAFAAMLGGCGSTRDPSITVSSARLGEVTDDALTLQIVLNLDNPNQQPLELLEFRYHVDVDGRRVYHGIRAAEMTLEQLSTREVEVPAVIVLSNAGWSRESLPPSAEFRVHGTLKYLLPGAIAQTLFDTGMRRPSAGVQGAGVVILVPATTQSASLQPQT